MPAQHSALSYTKWDNLDVSDDECDGDKGTFPALEPVLNANKTNAQRDADERTYCRFVDYMGRHKDAVPSEKRAMVARFVAVSDKQGQSSNTHRYSEIVSVLAQVCHPSDPLELSLWPAAGALLTGAVAIPPA